MSLRALFSSLLRRTRMKSGGVNLAREARYRTSIVINWLRKKPSDHFKENNILELPARCQDICMRYASAFEASVCFATTFVRHQTYKTNIRCLDCIHLRLCCIYSIAMLLACTTIGLLSRQSRIAMSTLATCTSRRSDWKCKGEYQELGV